MHAESLQTREWQLRPYLGVTLLFWTLGFAVAAGGSSDAQVEWPGPLANLILLIPLWKGVRWAAGALAVEATVLVGVMGSEAIPLERPIFGALTLLAVAQLLLMCSVWASREFENSSIFDR